MKTETPKEISREIAKRYTREGTGYADRLYQLAYAIEQALNAERERAAKIANAKADTLRRAAHVVQQPTAEALRMAELAIVSADDIAREIRGKD